MYWEKFWEHVITAANFTAAEKNAEFRFQFMLHADKKSAGKWRDLPIPFPVSEEDIAKLKDKSGISQIPSHLKHTVYRPDAITSSRK